MKTKTIATPKLAEGNIVADVRMSVNQARNKPQPEAKTSGIKMRGGGAATKGTTCRGPMA
jgi:hypothetical protein